MPSRRNGASSAVQRPGAAGSSVGHKAEEATSTFGSTMQSLGSAIRERSPDRGVIGNATTAVADSLESGGRYLQEHGLHGIGEDATRLIRNNPIPAVLIGFGIGFLLARALRS